MPRVCVFDVNETLLDLRALAPAFAQVFGNAAVLQEVDVTMTEVAEHILAAERVRPS